MKNRGHIVTMAGLGLNLALGVLYAWSMFSKQLTEPVASGGFGWSRTAATIPYTVAIACFALVMVPAGRLQDRLGPRVVATAGAVLSGLGFILAGLGSPQSSLPVILGFGVLAGMGFGLGYAAATPAAVKWFPPAKKGLITGIVVAGFGIAPVYIAPLSKYLLTTYGISKSFWVLGLVFLTVATIAAQFIRNPPPVDIPAKATSVANTQDQEPTWRDMVKSPVFYSLYLQFACGATAGLMIIGHMAKIVSVQSGGTIKAGFLFVALLAVFNAGGRIVAGMVSDIIGRTAALASVFVIQSITMFFFNQFTTTPMFILGAGIVGFNYGACLSLFPTTAADYWGTKNLGLNYGILFTAWGLGGVFGPILAGAIADRTGGYAAAYAVSAALLAFAALLTMLSYIQLSFSQEDKQLTIVIGRKRAKAA